MPNKPSPMDGGQHKLMATHAVYHRILQPAYERMIAQNVYKNKIRLKSGASGQLLHKRPKTTGYLGKSVNATSDTAPSTYWNPSAGDSFYWQKSIGPSLAPSAGYIQDGRSTSHPACTDEFNIRSSSRANSFSATTRVREVPVSSIYKKEIQEFRSRSPSARGVRASALTNRSLVASQMTLAPSAKQISHINHQPSRLEREHIQLEVTRERKKKSQLLSHRVNRMYYMLGSSSKIHLKYDISEDDLDKIRAIVISRGMKIPAYSYPNQRPSSTSGPHSSPRDIANEEESFTRQGSAKTIIPTGETMSQVKGSSGKVQVAKENRATSDNEGDGTSPEDTSSNAESKESKALDDGASHQEKLSLKSDSAAVLKSDTGQRSVTFLTDSC